MCEMDQRSPKCLDGRNRAISNLESLATLKTRDSNRWRLCDVKLRFEARDWRIRVKHSDTAKLRKGVRFESAIQNR